MEKVLYDINSSRYRTHGIQVEGQGRITIIHGISAKRQTKIHVAELFCRDLEKLGIVEREQFNEIPPHVEYSLSEKERALLPIFYEIAKWGEDNLSV